MHCNIPYCTMLCHILLRCAVLCCAVPYCITLYCGVVWYGVARILLTALRCTHYTVAVAVALSLLQHDWSKKNSILPPPLITSTSYSVSLSLSLFLFLSLSLSLCQSPTRSSIIVSSTLRSLSSAARRESEGGYRSHSRSRSPLPVGKSCHSLRPQPYLSPVVLLLLPLLFLLSFSPANQHSMYCTLHYCAFQRSTVELIATWLWPTLL
jgi:hypothetical protein